MKKLIAICLLVAMSLPALALVEGNQVAYAGGTAVGLKPGDMGQLDLTSSTDLVFTAGNGKITVPYAAITSFSYAEENLHRLGVLPTIAAGLVAARMKRRLLYISYVDPNGGTQTVTLEVSRESVGPMRTAINARIAKSACKGDCGRT